jgi:hypothetical protein
VQAAGGRRTAGDPRIDGGIGALAAAVEPGLHARIQHNAQVKAARAAIGATLAELTRQAQADGDLRPDTGPGDIALLMTVQVYLRPDQSRSEAADRVTDLIFHGLERDTTRPGRR